MIKTGPQYESIIKNMNQRQPANSNNSITHHINPSPSTSASTSEGDIEDAIILSNNNIDNNNNINSNNDKTKSKLKEYDETEPIELTIMGRPNVGKSTLMNSLTGGTYAITGEYAGCMAVFRCGYC